MDEKGQKKTESERDEELRLAILDKWLARSRKTPDMMHPYEAMCRAHEEYQKQRAKLKKDEKERYYDFIRNLPWPKDYWVQEDIQSEENIRRNYDYMNGALTRDGYYSAGWNENWYDWIKQTNNPKQEENSEEE